jgi:glycosyltransferase involved in cell wall biosynthesis
VPPIKILHLRDTHEIGGPGKTILETHRAIDASRFELHLAVFITRHESGDSPFVRAAREYGLPVHFVRGYNQYDPRMILRVIALVKRLGIDIVHAHEVKSDVIAYLATRLHRVPVMTTLHGWIGNGASSQRRIALDKRIVQSFDRVVAVSGRIRDEMLAVGMPEANLRLVHNAIVVERYARSGRRGILRELCGREVKAPVLVSIGRFSFEKGHADLLDALAIAAQRGHRPSLVLVGDGPERPRLEEKIRALGLSDSVHLTGYIAQPERVLDEADLMVLPSHTEGLPNVVLESLLMDVPVLATRVGGTPEVITDGETGYLVEARAPEALANGILDFLSRRDQWACTARRGRAMVEARFDFKARTRKIEAIYTELSGGMN